MEEKGKFRGGRGGQIVLSVPIDRTPKIYFRKILNIKFEKMEGVRKCHANENRLQHKKGI